MIITSSKNSVKYQIDPDTYAIFPKGKIIAIADESGMVSFKVTASRKTIFSELYDKITPHGDTPEKTVEMLSTML